MMICDGFVFNRERQTATSSHWKCAVARSLQCRARATIQRVNGVETVKLTNSKHSHPNNEHRVFQNKKIKHAKMESTK